MYLERHTLNCALIGKETWRVCQTRSAQLLPPKNLVDSKSRLTHPHVRKYKNTKTQNFDSPACKERCESQGRCTAGCSSEHSPWASTFFKIGKLTFLVNFKTKFKLNVIQHHWQIGMSVFRPRIQAWHYHPNMTCPAQRTLSLGKIKPRNVKLVKLLK